MKTLCFLSLFALVIPGCNPSKMNSQYSKQENEYVIAYNVAVKDALGKSNYEVFTMDFNGENPKNISKSPDVAWTYRAYKSRLFFISDRDTCYRCFFLYETDFNGNNIKKVSNLQLEDSWMDTNNEGTKLTVSGRKGKEIRYQLFLIDTKTGIEKQITDDTAAMYSDPAFSPTGNQVAFVYKKNKLDKTQNEEIYIMNINGTGMKQLSHYPQDNASKQAPGYKAGATHWHPTENFISYISMQNGRHNIFAVTPNGKKQWKLTDHDYSEGWHDWSADGKWLAFDMANKDETQYHIILMNWKSKETKQLTGTKHKYQQSPVFLQK